MEDRPQNFTAWLRKAARPPIEGAARLLVRFGMGPNAITVAGTLVASVSGVLAARGDFVWAGVVLLLGAPFDALDGAVARLSGSESRFGALLDSTLDRYVEAALLTGIAVYMANTANTLGVALTMITLFGSVMVSYVRARSEGLKIENKVGLFSRVERIIVLVVTLFTGWIIVGLWVLAIGTHLTVMQRVIQGYRGAQE